MALPPRAAAVYVLLSKPDTDPGTPRDTGTTINGYIDMGTPKPYQPSQHSFWSSQQWYQDYPADDVAKVHLGLVNAGIDGDYDPSVGAFGNKIYMQGYSENQEVDATFPDNIVYSYDPTPSPGPADPVPDPNGGTGTNTTPSTSPSGIPGAFYLPRWSSDTPYQVTDTSVGEGSVWPKKNTDYFITPSGFTSYTGGPSQFGPWSVDLSVANLQSEVLNLQTSSYEHYDFTQGTFDYKQTAKVKMYIDANICCWNDGTVITGTVTFQSIDVETEAVGRTASVSPDFTASYGFAGMLAKTGSTITDSGTQSFSVTIEAGYAPIEITIPTQTGTITFINDFSVDSVTPPA